MLFTQLRNGACDLGAYKVTSNRNGSSAPAAASPRIGRGTQCHPQVQTDSTHFAPAFCVTVLLPPQHYAYHTVGRVSIWLGWLRTRDSRTFPPPPPALHRSARSPPFLSPTQIPLSLAYLLSDPRATNATLRFFAISGRFDTLYSPPSEDQGSLKLDMT